MCKRYGNSSISCATSILLLMCVYDQKHDQTLCEYDHKHPLIPCIVVLLLHSASRAVVVVHKTGLTDRWTESWMNRCDQTYYLPTMQLIKSSCTKISCNEKLLFYSITNLACLYNSFPPAPEWVDIGTLAFKTKYSKKSHETQTQPNRLIKGSITNQCVL